MEFGQNLVQNIFNLFFGSIVKTRSYFQVFYDINKIAK